MNGARSKFLAGATFTEDKNRRIRGGDAFNELIDLAHARAAAHHVVLKLHLSAQALVFVTETLELACIFDSYRSQPGDGGKELQVVIGKGRGSVARFEVDQTQSLGRSGQGNAKERSSGRRSRRTRRLRGLERSRCVEIEYSDALFHHALSKRTANVDGMVGSLHAIPSGRSGDFSRGGVAKQNGPTLGRNNVKEQPEKLPLERTNVSERSDRGTYLENFKWQLVLVALGASLVLTGKVYSQEIENTNFDTPATSASGNFNTTGPAAVNTAAAIPQQVYTPAAGAAIRTTNELDELGASSFSLTEGPLLAVAIVALGFVIVKKVSARRQNNWRTARNSNSARKTPLIANKPQVLQS